MINKKDVITIKMPFPDISSRLAVKSHMYICHLKEQNNVGLVKCQTLKPYMLFSSPMKHYWDENPDINRNPFLRTTRIDCDKEFVTNHVRYDYLLRIKNRPDVCDDVLKHIESELLADGFIKCDIDENNLVKLNDLITYVSESGT